MSSTYLSLNYQIDTNKFLKSVHNLIKSYGDTKDCILKIEILKISQEDGNLIPKIEYKSNDS
jgi:hypothetical protein